MALGKQLKKSTVKHSKYVFYADEGKYIKKARPAFYETPKKFPNNVLTDWKTDDI